MPIEDNERILYQFGLVDSDSNLAEGSGPHSFADFESSVQSLFKVITALNTIQNTYIHYS